MKKIFLTGLSVLMFLIGNSYIVIGQANKEFKGRIAWSADGNWNDEDDWAASPIALAIFSEFGVKDKLVHFDYNNITSSTNKAWEKEHEKSIRGAISRFGYSKSIFHDCQKDLDATINSIANAINTSSKDNPLYFVLAGPMEVPYLGIQKSDPGKRKYVYCISHNRWNDGYASTSITGHNKRVLILQGINWIQVTDQNKFLATSPFGRNATQEEWEQWYWMRDSKDPNVRFLWDRMLATKRSDCSDAGMAYFLMTGDEECEINKLKCLLNEKKVPIRSVPRMAARIEAENFEFLGEFDIDKTNDPQTSQRLCVKYSGKSVGQIKTRYEEVFMSQSSSYDIDVRFNPGKNPLAVYSLYINDKQQGESWSGTGINTWQTKSIPLVKLNIDDEISIKVSDENIPRSNCDQLSSIKIDYIELRDRVQTNPFTTSHVMRLDNANALPGQIIVTDSIPGHLKYNGLGTAFLSGPDNPEDFLYRGELQPDGTRKTNGLQDQMIKVMAEGGINVFHCIMFRMQRCNIKQEGDDTHCPFYNHDPAKGLNPNVLDQWDHWLTRFEEMGITVELEFYNDATDVEMMGWKLDNQGNLHPDEKQFIEGIVKRLKHHKNIIWSIEESGNKLPAVRTLHFKKIGELIAATDNFNHPIVQSFVIPDDPEGDFPKGGAYPSAYKGDPNIKLVSWLHVLPFLDDIERQHKEYLKYRLQDGKDFVVLSNEMYKQPSSGEKSRLYMWSCAMAGIHPINAYQWVNKIKLTTLQDDARISRFFEQTDFYNMNPTDNLASASTKWVLSNPDNSYILYSYNYKNGMGVKGIAKGFYKLTWFDPVTGATVLQTNVRVDGTGEAIWKKPVLIGEEVALYVKRL